MNEHSQKQFFWESNLSLSCYSHIKSMTVFSETEREREREEEVREERRGLPN